MASLIFTRNRVRISSSPAVPDLSRLDLSAASMLSLWNRLGRADQGGGYKRCLFQGHPQDRLPERSRADQRLHQGPDSVDASEGHRHRPQRRDRFGALSAALSVRAVGKDKVLALLLPDKESSPQSAEFATKQARQLGIEAITVDITPVLEAFGTYEKRDAVARAIYPEFGPATCVEDHPAFGHPQQGRLQRLHVDRVRSPGTATNDAAQRANRPRASSPPLAPNTGRG